MWNRIDAAAFALVAFAIPYLAAGLRRFAGHNWWWVLVWPKEAGALWGPLGFELGGCALVALLVYRLRLQGLIFGTSVVPFWVHDTPIRAALHLNAAATAVAVFLVPYLALGVGLGGFRNWMSLLWPLDLWGSFNRVVLFVLAAFAAVSAFVFVLKLAFLAAAEENETLERKSGEAFGLRMDLTAGQQEAAPLWAGSGSGSTNGELGALREEVKSLRDNLENSKRHAAEAEAKLRKMEQAAGGSPSPGGAAAGSGGDAKFKQVKRAFAKRYHPDNRTEGGIERTVRVEFYKEFSQVLEDIERGKA